MKLQYVIKFVTHSSIKFELAQDAVNKNLEYSTAYNSVLVWGGLQISNPTSLEMLYYSNLFHHAYF
jgi:hypothetical protein